MLLKPKNQPQRHKEHEIIFVSSRLCGLFEVLDVGMTANLADAG
jgi:hypothetical protein